MGSVVFHSFSIHVFFPSFIFLSCNLPSSKSMVLGNETDHLGLLSFKAELTSDPLQTIALWNESTHFCNWVGVSCSRRHHRVIGIDLRSRGLTGLLSPAIGNLSFLREFFIYNNRFTGKIPQEIGRLSRLRRLGLGNNSFSGEIPANISRCLNLVLLNLAGNNLVGRFFPIEFQSLMKLQAIYLYSNNLTGEIPAFLGNFSAIQIISALDNNFQGSVPDTLGQLTNLTFLGFATNNLSGTIPPSIFNLSSLTSIDLPENQVGGNLPSNIGLSLPRLGWLNVAKNNFTGGIPVSLSNASQLSFLGFNANGFTGRVPNFDGLQSLRLLALNKNQLGLGETDDLSFFSSLINCSNLALLALSDNNFGGVFPKSIGNFSKVTFFSIGANPISGNIPTEIGELVNLETLFLGPNKFSGSIPESIGKLEKLKVLSLSGNKLSGYIPSSLGNLTLLIRLHLAVNNLLGSVPSSLAKCQNLLWMDLSQNNLSGYIPKEVFGLSSLSIALDLSYNRLVGSLLLAGGDLPNLVSFDVSNNMMSGEIPGSLGGCTSLSVLSLAGNFFLGGIPPSLSSLRGIEFLDLSRNNLTGKIPDYLGSFLFLQNLNLSFNDFEGGVPEGGVFKNASEVSVYGNRKICGGVAELELPICAIKEASKKHGVSRALKYIVPIFSGILVLILVFVFVYVYKWRHTKKVSMSNCLTRDILPKLSYGDLYSATNGFSPTNLIGSGKFSSVYKGVLYENETVVAVKVLNLQVQGATKSFMAECEALRSVRHRNILKILNSCSSIDFRGNDFKVLVYEYMVNGSLEGWLHQNPRSVGGGKEEPRSLTLLQRLNIAIDVACALDYLHHQYGTSMVHCDIKPSNVLLDIDLVAHLGDFGLAKFLAESTHASSTSQTSSMGIKGTIGYAAPEYGMGSEISTYGDVYSCGILMLEIFTGKRPTDDMFNNGQNLHNFVNMAIPDRVMEISDLVLLHNEEEDTKSKNFKIQNQLTYDKIKECLVSVFRIGVACSMELPKERMDISDATTELHLIRDTLLGSRIHRGKGDH